MFIDTSGWTADHPAWAFNKNDAIYHLTPGDDSSRLSSGRVLLSDMPLDAERKLSFSAEVLGGHGLLYIREITAEGYSTIKNEGGRGVVGITYQFTENAHWCELLLGAFPDRDATSFDHGVIDPAQVITFRNVAYGLAPTYGEVAASVAAPAPVAPPEPIAEPLEPSLMDRIMAIFRF